MQRWAGEAEFVGVAWSGGEDDFQSFVDRYSLTFPQISDAGADVFTRFEISTQPAMVLIYPDGRTETVFGAADDALIDMLLTGATA